MYDLSDCSYIRYHAGTHLWNVDWRFWCYFCFSVHLLCQWIEGASRLLVRLLIPPCEPGFGVCIEPVKGKYCYDTSKWASLPWFICFLWQLCRESCTANFLELRRPAEMLNTWAEFTLIYWHKNLKSAERNEEFAGHLTTTCPSKPGVRNLWPEGQFQPTSSK